MAFDVYTVSMAFTLTPLHIVVEHVQLIQLQLCFGYVNKGNFSFFRIWFVWIIIRFVELYV